MIFNYHETIESVDVVLKPLLQSRVGDWTAVGFLGREKVQETSMKLVSEKSVLVDPLSEDTMEGGYTAAFFMLIMSRQD